MTTPASLPDLPPHVFSALQIIDRALAETPLNRARSAECDQAVQVLAQYCVEATKKEKEASAKRQAEVEKEKVCDVPPPREITPKQERVNAQ